jgi:tRNA modification GTPase
VAVIAVRGEPAGEVVARHFVRSGSRETSDVIVSEVSRLPLRVNRIRFGRWRRDSQHPGEELIVCRTAEDLYEIHCHGGAAAIDAIASDLTRCGAVLGCSLTGTAISDPLIPTLDILAEARTERTAAILLDQCRGALRRENDEIAAMVDAGVSPLERVTQLLNRRTIGEHLSRPFQVVLAGPPIVGKSSLINALLGYDRAIVFDEPGTTRDVVSAITAFDGWPVELSDTAGLRETLDPLEAAGVDRTTRQLTKANLVLWVQDASSTTIADPPVVPSGVGLLVVTNKSDLLAVNIRSHTSGTIVSALTGEGLSELKAQIAQALVPRPPAPGDGVPINEVQAKMLIDWLVF